MLTIPVRLADTFYAPSQTITTFNFGTCNFAFLNLDTVEYDVCYKWVVSNEQIMQRTFEG